ncbi:protein-tyrosine phosphatase [Metarhizium album ARSEF 1941]|uniref:Protein-tyrosine phosphatase n=1 Tax=Metarhizium album (strain ARSEF 1941) TaxID=1081103 RepID=A0A0B2WVC2_METAS|nr:protein-tyrosine phosphatase [Metarhizium album ARSEF 1941]KHN97402.1 protein-tyrosine phosphatase [Metarhizium album ARSEF 1941]
MEDLDAVLLDDLQSIGGVNLPYRAWHYISPLEQQTPAPRVWIYEIATGPNTLIFPGEPPRVRGIGGIVWSQVTRVTELSLSHPSIRDHVEDLTDDTPLYPPFLNSVEWTWMQNPDYDRRWETYGGVQGIPFTFFSDPPRSATPQEVRDVMTLVTSSQLFPDQARRQVLQELLDWNVEREPHRNFPLLRRGQPPRLDTSALSQIDWSKVQIPPQIQMALLSGLANVAQCGQALRLFKNFFLDEGPKRERRGQKGDACNQLADFIKDNKGNRNISQPLCQKIRKIELTIALSDELAEGSWDQIGGTLEGPAGKAEFFFAEAPDAGTQKTIAVDVRKYFKSDEINLDGIDTMTINAQGIFSNSWNALRNDEFKIKDIIIRAECSDPTFKAENNKYVGINTAYQHPGRESLFDFTGPYTKKTVGTLKIRPSDWSFNPPCTVIKDLTYHFMLADELGGGTYDSIYFTLGQGKKVALGSDLGRGFSKKDAINLQAIFGSKTLDLRDLGSVTLWDDSSEIPFFNSDEWYFKGITFSATCTDVSKTVEMRKFESVYARLQRRDNAVVWSGDVSPNDWLGVA